MTHTETLIVGAGPAGLAVAACLKRVGIPFILLEQADKIAAPWHRHYDRLQLHTDKAHSELPFLHYPKDYPKYPSRAQVISYLQDYAWHFAVTPRFGAKVVRANHRKGEWHTETTNGDYVSPYLIVATGYNGQPYSPVWPGQNTFDGEILHSSAYRNGAPYRDKRVLVVGFGNSGGEIAIDLWEHGAQPSLSVRSPVNILPRDLLGLPLLAIAIPMAHLPSRLADALTTPILRVVIGRLSKLGLRQAAWGPFTQIDTRERIPLIDVGTVELLRRGRVDVVPGIERFTHGGVAFTDGTEWNFDAVVLATGYRPKLDAFLEQASTVCDNHGTPYTSGRPTQLLGLYFCGFYVSPAGMLREIAIEAKRIAQDIARRGRRPRTS